VDKHIEIKLLDEALSLDYCKRFVADERAGAEVFFEGTVRNQTGTRSVKQLDFEAYVPMAEKELHKIAVEMQTRWSCFKIVIHHRIGLAKLGEPVVIIGLSTAHRKEAFQACEYAIDTLKETVPIWKKEVFEDGEVWVSAHP